MAGLLLLAALCATAGTTSATPRLPLAASTPLDWWQTALVYQLYPLSFKDSDGDGYGDLRGVLEKLDYIKELGATAIWFNPINKTPMKNFGYDVSNYTAIDPIFGTFEDFKILLKRMKELDLKFIMDYVGDHSSIEIEWFNKSESGIEPYTDYFIWHPGHYDNETGIRYIPNNWPPLYGNQSWFWSEKRQMYSWRTTIESVPALNWRSERLKAEMMDVLRFWLDQGVDGFRVDSASRLVEDAQFRNITSTFDPIHNQPETYELVAEYRAFLDQYKTKDNHTRVLILETMGHLKDIVKFYGTKEKPGGHFPFNWLLKQNAGHNANASVLNWIVNTEMEAVPEGMWYNWLSGNHDSPRIASRAPGRVDAMNMMVLLLPGTAVSYMGEEIGMTNNPDMNYSNGLDAAGCLAGPEGYRAKSQDPERSPLQWDNSTNAGFSTAAKTWMPVNKNYVMVNIAAQERAENSHLKVYRRLARLRRTKTIQRGAVDNQVVSDYVFAFTRELQGEDTYIAVMNVGHEQQTVNLTAVYPHLPGTARVIVAGVSSGYYIGDEVTLEVLPLKSNSSLVLTTGEVRE
ncbi:maltase 2-like [Bacillus rossius redtenbacheri]|uniref:maltase 2-like n=1 Tax=Bacillus rossius redtenbacheri TaxID=93214 RepID=UPI002FDDFB3A